MGALTAGLMDGALHERQSSGAAWWRRAGPQSRDVQGDTEEYISCKCQRGRGRDQAHGACKCACCLCVNFVFMRVLFMRGFYVYECCVCSSMQVLGTCVRIFKCVCVCVCVCVSVCVGLCIFMLCVCVLKMQYVTCQLARSFK